MPTSQNIPPLPQNYTFTPGGVMLHRTAYERLEKLVEKTQNRDPDLHDLYIYNDFYGYAILDLVDETLSSIHTFVVKKKWLEAWHALTALTEFMQMCPEWLNVDDGERVEATDKVYGALLITTIRALASASPSLLNEATLPDLETCLTRMARWGDDMDSDLSCRYSKVLKGYGRLLFGMRTLEEREQMKAARKGAYEAFVRGLSEAERKRRGDRTPGVTERDDMDDDDEDDEDEEDEGDDSGVWYGKAVVEDLEYNHGSFKLTPAWKEYKNQLASAPRYPLRGPRTWDLTKWSAADKQEFSFNRYDNDSGEEGMIQDDIF
ncbi:hypothetical protein DFH11DRAFT_1841190 [Phellopilus nigrolimitatus]|nr:hypothetical protein DFH11DRAFT_1841190 [Phellopilus nigrolimitatus]